MPDAEETDQENKQLPECAVLRCRNHMGGRFTRTAPLWVRVYPVCEDHGRKLEVGEKRRFDDRQRTILMGDDLAGAHEWLVTSIGLKGRTQTVNVGVVLNVARTGTDEEKIIEFSVSPKTRKDLGEMLLAPGLDVPGGGETDEDGGTYESLTPET